MMKLSVLEPLDFFGRRDIAECLLDVIKHAEEGFGKNRLNRKHLQMVSQIRDQIAESYDRLIDSDWNLYGRVEFSDYLDQGQLPNRGQFEDERLIHQSVLDPLDCFKLPGMNRTKDSAHSGLFALICDASFLGFYDPWCLQVATIIYNRICEVRWRLVTELVDR